MNDIARTPRIELYPEIEPFDSGMLPVDARHTLYWSNPVIPTVLPWCFYTAGQVRAAAQASGASSIRRSIVSSCSISAARAAPSRTAN